MSPTSASYSPILGPEIIFAQYLTGPRRVLVIFDRPIQPIAGSTSPIWALRTSGGSPVAWNSFSTIGPTDVQISLPGIGSAVAFLDLTQPPNTVLGDPDGVPAQNTVNFPT